MPAAFVWLRTWACRRWLDANENPAPRAYVAAPDSRGWASLRGGPTFKWPGFLGMGHIQPEQAPHEIQRGASCARP